MSFCLLYFFYLKRHADFTKMFIVLSSVNKNIIIEHKAQSVIYFFMRKIDVKAVHVHTLFTLLFKLSTTD